MHSLPFILMHNRCKKRLQLQKKMFSQSSFYNNTIVCHSLFTSVSDYVHVSSWGWLVGRRGRQHHRWTIFFKEVDSWHRFVCQHSGWAKKNSLQIVQSILHLIPMQLFLILNTPWASSEKTMMHMAYKMHAIVINVFPLSGLWCTTAYPAEKNRYLNRQCYFRDQGSITSSAAVIVEEVTV